MKSIKAWAYKCDGHGIVQAFSDKKQAYDDYCRACTIGNVVRVEIKIVKKPKKKK